MRGASLQRDFEELRAVFVRYIKDETIAPLKATGRFLAFGALGSLFVGFGSALLLLGTLRYLQWAFPFFDGSESWIPYLIVVILGSLALAVTVSRIFAGGSKRRQSSK
jgi:hypothetical protein